MIIENGQIIYEQYGEKYFVPVDRPWNIEKFPTKTCDEKIDIQYNKNDLCYIILYLTDKCNLSCDYCFEKKGNRKKTIVTVESFLRFIERYKEKNIVVRFFGGEPLLNMKLLKEFADLLISLKLKGYSININVFTNLYSISIEDIDYFNENNITVFTSIDGPREIHDLHRYTASGKGSYDNVFNNSLVIARKMKKRLCIRTVYYLNSKVSLMSIIDHFVNNKLYIVSIAFPYRIDSQMNDVYSKKMLNKLRDELKKFEDKYLESVRDRKFNYVGIHPFSTYIKNLLNKKNFMTDEACGVCNTNIAISTEGELYPCHAFTNMKEYKMGDVINGVKQNILANFRGEKLEKCRKCPICYYCLLRCPAYMFDLDSNGDERNVYCEISTMIFITSMRIYYRLKTEFPEYIDLIKKFINYGADIYGNV